MMLEPRGPTGTADDTDVLAAWLAELQDRGLPGVLRGGRYRVRRGALGWKSRVDDHVPGPVIYAGSGATLVAIPGSGIGPLLSISNSAPYRAIRGGHLGPLYFEDPERLASDQCHGLMLSGVEGLTVEGAFGLRLSGDVVHVAQRPDNPDGHNVTYCEFGIIRADRCRGWALNNALTGNGMGHCDFRAIAALHCGAWRGAGAANHAGSISCMNAPVWVLDWFAWPGHVTSRNRVLGMEMDSPLRGLHIEGHEDARLEGIRFVHRSFSWTDREQGRPSETDRWPLTAVQVGGTSGMTTQDVVVQATHFIHSDVRNVGTLYNLCQDPGLRGIRIDARIAGPGAGLVDPSRIAVSANPSATYRVTSSGRTVVNRLPA